MSGPVNAVVGEQDAPTELPQTNVDENALFEERKLAKYSKTKEFKKLQEYMENRIKFYQRFLPNGTRVEGDPKTGGPTINLPDGISPEMLAVYWNAACLVINEFENVLAAYAQAAEAVKDADRG